MGTDINIHALASGLAKKRNIKKHNHRAEARVIDHALDESKLRSMLQLHHRNRKLIFLSTISK